MMSVTSTSKDEKDSEGTQQAGEEAKGSKFSKHMPSSSTRSLVFRNPRIVRVSRNWGGKDRHSKVYTIKGLRDRRIRLSVPTAVQLYDLQDRLCLPQPSKVIDWLIDVTKDDIDKLPPLQFPPGLSSSQFFHHQQMLLSQSLHEHSRSSSSSCYPLFLDPNPTFGGVHSLGIGINSGNHEHGEAESSSLRARNDKAAANFIDKGKWIMGRSPNEENQEGVGNFASFINNSMHLNPYFHSNSSNLLLSSPQFGSHGSYNLIQLENSLNSNGPSMSLMPPSSSLALSSTSQLFVSTPPPATTILPQFFPPPYHPFVANSSMVESGSRNINGFQFLSPSSQPVSTSLKPPPLQANSGFVLLQDNNGSSHRERENNAHS